MTKNNLNFSNMSNGGQNARYNIDHKTIDLEPMKTTGDIKKEEVKLADPLGVAKASPVFKVIKKDEKQDEEAKAKALAAKTQKIPE